MHHVLWFKDTGIDKVAQVGGKNASLGEMLRELDSLGIKVPDGFSVTADAYRYFLKFNNLESIIENIFEDIKRDDVANMAEHARKVRNFIHGGNYPGDLRADILEAYHKLSDKAGMPEAYVAVRSSATAEDLPNASFAGQQESYLMVHGEAELLDTIKRAFASLFTTRAISYREDMGFDHFKVALSVGVQQMVRSDRSSSGVMFTLDTETGFPNVIFINSIWGLGENIVQGRVIPDSFYVHKPKLKMGFKPLVWKKLGDKELTLTYDETGHRLENVKTPQDMQKEFSLSDNEVLKLAKWATTIEDHYSRKHGKETPMDIEWAKDGFTNELYIVQARPETVHSQNRGFKVKIYHLKEKSDVLVKGLAVGEAVAVGKVRVVKDPKDMDELQEGEVLVTEITDPDWEPIMKKTAAIITEKGGRTSHAAIVARELGIPAIVGAKKAMEVLKTDTIVTLSTVEGEIGKVYQGALPYEVEEVDLLKLEQTRTQIMLNVGNPEQALHIAMLPSHGVGLARMEFIFASLGVHPLALIHYETLSINIKRQIDELTKGYKEKTDYFTDKLSQGIGMIAAAFWPREVILRFSDFKTNEYAHLLGGEFFEPKEENPMLGWRGASRYYHPDYKEGFVLEVAAVKKAREVFGFNNLKVMVPFCRTVEEGKKVLEVMGESGLVQGQDDLEVYVMAELPSNILQASEFAQIFDGFSIGSNDLTQLTLGVDRDSERVAPLFDERDESVKRACAMLINEAHRYGCKVGICGQAPSDYPEFAAFLVEQGIDSISLNPDSVLRTSRKILEIEKLLV